MSTFAELTSVCNSSCAASSPTRSQISHEFNGFVKDLEFDESPQEVIPVANAQRETPENLELSLSESSESDDDEDSDPTYQYEKKNRFRGLEERIEGRLATDSADIDTDYKKLKELARVKAPQPGIKFTPGSIVCCVMCAKPFPTAELLQAHTSKVHSSSENQHKCDICSKAYKHKKNLKAHMAIHTKEFQCSDCNQIFQSAATLDTHISKNHKSLAEEKKIVMKKCEQCKKQFPEEAYVKHAWYCNNKEKKTAEKIASTPILLLASTASVRDKSCQACGENFASRQSMLRHVGRKHPELKNDPNVTEVRYVSTESPSHAYACQDCGKRLTTRAALTQHRARAHLDAARHKCHLCLKSYTVSLDLRKHIKRVHESVKPRVRGKLPDHDNIC